MSDKLRVAVVGAGRWARRAHIPGWQRDPRVEVVALADTDEDALAEAGTEFGVDGSSPTTANCSTTPTSTSSTSPPATGAFEISRRRSRPASTCCARSRCTTTIARPSALAELAEEQGPEDQARLHLPLRARPSSTRRA